MKRRMARRITLAAVAALVAGGATWAGGAAYGLWSTTASFGQFTLAAGKVGIAVTDLAEGSSASAGHTAAAGESDTLRLPLGPAEAAQLIASPAGAAWNFDVVTTASGNAGLEYSIEVPQFASGTVFGAADISVFQVSDAAACSASAVADSNVNSGAIQGISPEYEGLKKKTDHWCVVAVADMAKMTLGPYANTATVTGLGPDGTQVTDEDTWEADLLPDPADEPTDRGLEVTHEVLGPQ
jgi:hypothetical protein